MTLHPTVGEDHRGAGVSRVCAQSCHDQRRCLPATGASDGGGEGAVELIRAQLDFTLVCGRFYRCLCFSLRESFSLFCS